MLRPRIESLVLHYGCHDDSWVWSESDRPVVITGPNGSGKSTLVDGLIRTLFGFDRKRPRDAEELEARHPWGGDSMGGRVVIVAGRERVEIERDFATDRVTVSDRHEGVERFQGDGNPASRNQEALHYRQILAELLGLNELDAYGRTLFIRQGGLPVNAMGDELLHVAAGGHLRVEDARRRVAEEHRRVTRRPLHAAARAAINPRQLEKLEEEIVETRKRLASARQAAERRGPLAQDRDRSAARLAMLHGEIEELEYTLAVLARRDVVELGVRRRRAELQRIEAAQESVRRARERLHGGVAELDRVMGPGRYPDDFPERLARAEVRWRDLAAEPRIHAPRLLVVTAILAAGAVAAAVSDQPVVAAGLAALTALAAGIWVALWAAARRRRRAARRDVAEAMEGVPEADRVNPGSRDLHLSRYRAQEKALTAVAAGRTALAEALREGRALLRELAGAETTRARDRPSPQRKSGSATERLLARLRADEEEARARVTEGRLELDRIGDATLALADGIPPTEAAVADALRERRSERAALQDELQTLGQALLERGTPAESVDALEARLAALEPQREVLERKARVFETAHALLGDAYEAFRERDQDRLSERVSEHVVQLSGGRLGPLDVGESLDEARVRVGGRSVALATPPLSFGEYHVLQLGVRLGAADFLAGVGILPPLVVDEPFAHLDAERASRVWESLVEVARERQVILTTQSESLLTELGVEPQVRLQVRP